MPGIEGGNDIKLKTGRVHENIYCIPERAKKAKRKQYRKDEKLKVSIQTMHKQIIKVLESEQRKEQGKGKKLTHTRKTDLIQKTNNQNGFILLKSNTRSYKRKEYYFLKFQRT